MPRRSTTPSARKKSKKKTERIELSTKVVLPSYRSSKNQRIGPRRGLYNDAEAARPQGAAQTIACFMKIAQPKPILPPNSTCLVDLTGFVHRLAYMPGPQG